MVWWWCWALSLPAWLQDILQHVLFITWQYLIVIILKIILFIYYFVQLQVLFPRWDLRLNKTGSALVILKSIPFIYYIVQLQISFLLWLNKTKSTAFLSYSVTASATTVLLLVLLVLYKNKINLDPKQHPFCSGLSSVFRNAQ